MDWRTPVLDPAYPVLAHHPSFAQPGAAARADFRARLRHDEHGRDPADPVRGRLVPPASSSPLVGGNIQSAGRSGTGEGLGHTAVPVSAAPVPDPHTA